MLRGRWEQPDGIVVDVAVKIIKDETSHKEKLNLLKEAAIMSQFDYLHIVKLLAIVDDENSVSQTMMMCSKFMYTIIAYHCD